MWSFSLHFRCLHHHLYFFLFSFHFFPLSPFLSLLISVFTTLSFILSSLSFWIWSSSDRYRVAALLWRAQYIPIHHICPQHFPFLPHLMDNGLLCTGCSTRIHLSAHPSLHSFQPLWSSWQMHESLLPVRVCPEQRDWTRLARQLWVFLRTVMSSRRWLRSRFSHR